VGQVGHAGGRIYAQAAAPTNDPPRWKDARMTAAAGTTPAIHLGFLAIVQEPAGVVGGLLVTNSWGRPLEFRLTSAVQPNRVQAILYGAALDGYLCGELIGKALVEKSSTPLQWLITDHPAALEVRRHVGIPVGLWSPDAGATEQLPITAGMWAHAQFADDVGKVQSLLASLGKFDWGEPFQRIREAVAEARKMGIGKAQAA
jgi:hypothetical protein